MFYLEEFVSSSFFISLFLLSLYRKDDILFGIKKDEYPKVWRPKVFHLPTSCFQDINTFIMVSISNEVVKRIIEDYSNHDMTFPNVNLIQKIYNMCIYSLSLHNFTCPCCNEEHSFIFFGTYHRSIELFATCFSLQVNRIQCKHCKSTHALFFDFIIPYTRSSVFDITQLLLQYIHHKKKQRHSFSDVRHLIQRFLPHFKKLPLFQSVDEFFLLNRLKIGAFLSSQLVVMKYRYHLL